MTHSEEFLREIADCEKYKRDFKTAATHFLKKLSDSLSACNDEGQEQCYRRLFQNDRFYAMGRCGTGFENAVPETPDKLV